MVSNGNVAVPVVCQVFVWEDADQDVCSEYRAYEGHREDVLCLAVMPSRQLLATGDYEGRINVRSPRLVPHLQLT